MSPTDQSHFLKYVTTLGVAIIVSSLGIGGFLLQTQNDLLIDRSKVSQLTPTAQQAIERKQEILLSATKVAPFALGGLAAIGLTLTVTGLIGWRRRQAVLDDKDVLERDKLRFEVTQMTPSEKEERTEKDVREVLEDDKSSASISGHVEPSSDTKENIRDYFTPEEIRSRVKESELILAAKLQEIWGPDNVRSELSIRNEKGGRRALIDAVAFDRTTSAAYIFELKYLGQGLRSDRIANILTQLGNAKSMLQEIEQFRDLSLVPVGIILVDGDPAKSARRIRQQLQEYGVAFNFQAALLAYNIHDFREMRPESLIRDIIRSTHNW